MKDEVMPESKWVFNDEVTDSFDDMLERSIPQYDIMREMVFNLGVKFVQPKTQIVDLGCSRGEALAPFVRKFGAYNRYVGVDVSQPMLEAARKRFDGMIKAGLLDIFDMDLRIKYPPVLSSLTLAVLILQFVPIDYRLQIMHNIYNHLIPGGALIMVEKVLGGSYIIDEKFKELYVDKKLDAGYGIEAIERKSLSLEGVLVPVTARWNEDMLRSVGFNCFDCFWRWNNFAGWVAIKEG